MGTERLDITGKKFGRLTVIGYACTNKSRKSVWKCKCECGKETFVVGNRLIKGHTKSCGCLRVDSATRIATKHGYSKTRLYGIWCAMKGRCTNQNNTSYERYGGRGIAICDEWQNNFQAFYNWAISHGYSDESSIDRIDNNGNYEPSNCRWVTMKEQSNNRSSSVCLTHNGETHTLKEWSELTGIKYTTLYSRYSVGESVDEILKQRRSI